MYGTNKTFCGQQSKIQFFQNLKQEKTKKETQKQKTAEIQRNVDQTHAWLINKRFLLTKCLRV